MCDLDWQIRSDCKNYEKNILCATCIDKFPVCVKKLNKIILYTTWIDKFHVCVKVWITKFYVGLGLTNFDWLRTKLNQIILCATWIDKFPVCVKKII